PACTEELDDLVLADLLAAEHSFEHFAHGTARKILGNDQRARQQIHRVGAATGAPVRRRLADEDDLGAVLHVLRAGDLLGEVRARIVAAEAFGIAAVENRERERGVDPGRRVEDVSRMRGEPRREREAPRLADLAKAVEYRPRSLWVDVVGGD